MARVLMTSMSVLLVLTVAVVPPQKECDADQEACVSLLQSGLVVQDAQAAQEPDHPESWIMPTGKPTEHIGKVVGSTTAVIDGAPLRCLEASCEYGLFLTEELRHVGREKGYETQISLYNFWGLDQTLPQGDITVGDVEANHPVGDNTSYYKLKGHVIVDVLKNMLSQHGPLGEGGSTGSWLQIAGLRFQATWAGYEAENVKESLAHKVVRVVNGQEEVISVPPTTGEWTLQNVHVDLEEGRWAPLDPNYSYNVVSNHQVRFGVKTELIQASAQPVDDTGSSIAEIIIDAFQKGSPLSPPKLDDRELLGVMDEKLGINQGRFDIVGCRDHTCAYGILACEEFRRVGRELGHGTQIALYSGALFRAALGKGDVYVKDVLKVHPDGTLLSFFWLSGVTIRKTLLSMLQDHGAPGKGTKSSWMQMAGLRFQATFDDVSKDWTLGPVEADLENGAWQEVDNDLDYSVAADAYMVVEGGGNDNVARNAVLQRGPLNHDENAEWRMPLESGPAVVAVMAGLFRHQDAVSPPSVDDRHCLNGNCTWLPGTHITVEEVATAEESRSDEAWWMPNARAGWAAATGTSAGSSSGSSSESASVVVQRSEDYIESRLLWIIVCSALALMLCLCCCARLCK